MVKIDADTQFNAGPPTEIRSLSDEEREAARPDVRLFVLLLDDYHVKRGNDLAVRKPIIEFIQNQLSPLDMVALMYPLTPVTELHFSRDRGRSSAPSSTSWAGSSTTSRATCSRRNTPTIPPRPSRRFGTTSRWAR